MKDNLFKFLRQKQHVTRNILMVITCLLFSITVYGQQTTMDSTNPQSPNSEKQKEIEGNISFDQFISLHADLPEVKSYLADPANSHARTVVKCAYILNTEQRNNFSASDIQSMEQIVNEAQVKKTKNMKTSVPASSFETNDMNGHSVPPVPDQK